MGHRRKQRLALAQHRRELLVERAAQPGAVCTYTCKECRGAMVTVHVDAGVTPMMISCMATKNCRGSSVSDFYASTEAEPGWEWYYPSAKERKKLSPFNAEHVAKGGVLLRRIEKEN